MPVQFVKPQPNPATAERVAEVFRALDHFARALVPVVQRAGEGMGRSLRSVAERRPA